MNVLQRFEFKFVITAVQREALLTAFNGDLRPDVNGGGNGAYPIVSLYYDTPDRRCYWEAWRGVPSRRKLRLRVYGTPEGSIPVTSFVEVKHKLDGVNVKRRVQTSPELAMEIAAGRADAGAFAPQEALVVREVHRLVHSDGFAPVCVVRYHRHAFSLEVDGCPEPLRVTFDREISGRFRDLEPQPDDRRHDFTLLPSDSEVMELKCAGAIPFPVATVLAKCGLSPRSFSKYCTALRLADATCQTTPSSPPFRLSSKN